MNDQVDDIHTDIEYPIKHYGQDQESLNKKNKIIQKKTKINLQIKMHE